MPPPVKDCLGKIRTGLIVCGKKTVSTALSLRKIEQTRPPRSGQTFTRTWSFSIETMRYFFKLQRRGDSAQTMDVLFQTAQSLENSRTLEMFSRSENHCVCSNGSIHGRSGTLAQR